MSSPDPLPAGAPRDPTADPAPLPPPPSAPLGELAPVCFAVANTLMEDWGEAVRAVLRALEPPTPGQVRAVRVLSARVEALALLLGDRKLRNRARAVRRSAGSLRDADVQGAPADDRLQLAREMLQGLPKLAERVQRRWRRQVRRVSHGGQGPFSSPRFPDGLLARAAVLARRATVLAAARPTTVAGAHRLRLAVKRLRYASAILAASGLPLPSPLDVPALRSLQRALGDARDRRLTGSELAEVVHAASAQLVPDASAGAAGLAEAESGVPVAGIELGSSAARLLVASVSADGRITRLHEGREPTRLAEGLGGSTDAAAASDPARGGRVLSERAKRETLAALGRFVRAAQTHGVPPEGMEAVATAAVRMAADGGEFLEEVRNATGLRVRIITQQEEAELAAEGVAAQFAIGSVPSVVADVGGGSTQVSLLEGGRVVRSVLIAIGAVVIAERFGGHAALCEQRWTEARAAVREAVRGPVKALRPPAGCLAVAVGGSATTVAGLALAHAGALSLHAEPEAAIPARLQGVVVDRGAMRRVIRALRASTVESLAGTPGVAPGRADVALSGAMVLREVLRALPKRAAEQWVVHLGGVREGLVLRAARALAARER